MPLSESTVITLVSAGVGIAVVIANKVKCAVKHPMCRFGCMDEPLVEDHNVEFKKYKQMGMIVLEVLCILHHISIYSI